MSIGLLDHPSHFGTHGTAQGAGALVAYLSQGTPVSYVVAAVIAAVLTQIAIFVRGEIQDQRRADRHRKQVAADVAAWSGLSARVQPPVPQNTDESLQ